MLTFFRTAVIWDATLSLNISPESERLLNFVINYVFLDFNYRFQISRLIILNFLRLLKSFSDGWCLVFVISVEYHYYYTTEIQNLEISWIFNYLL